MQQAARDELKMFSQARGARSLAELPGYAYDSRGGQGITVYIMDTGINPNHPVSCDRLYINYSQRGGSLISRNSQICKEAYVGSISQMNHGSKLIPRKMAMALVLPQKSD